MDSQIKNILSPKTGTIYKKLLVNVEKDKLPHRTFDAIWEAYLHNCTEKQRTNRLNGQIFEYAICETLMQHGVGTLYYQCKFWSMPNDRIDLGGWAIEKYPIIISCKTSIRERWKQADLEGRLLKGIFPNTKSYMLMNDESEARILQRRIKDKTTTGIDKVYIAKSAKFDEFVNDLKSFKLVETEAIMPLNGTLFKAESEKYESSPNKN